MDLLTVTIMQQQQKKLEELENRLNNINFLGDKSNTTESSVNYMGDDSRGRSSHASTTTQIPVQSHGKTNNKNNTTIQTTNNTTVNDLPAAITEVQADNGISHKTIIEIVTDPKALSNAPLHQRKTETNHPEIKHRLDVTVVKE